jgi:hypothetical protein
VLCLLVSGPVLMSKPSDIVQGTLEMLILKTLALEPMHGYDIAVRFEQMSKGVFRNNVIPGQALRFNQWKLDRSPIATLFGPRGCNARSSAHGLDWKMCRFGYRLCAFSSDGSDRWPRHLLFDPDCGGRGGRSA